jgi:DNA-directed RNA polymerase specialized sigma24 family protein
MLMDKATESYIGSKVVETEVMTNVETQAADLLVEKPELEVVIAYAKKSVAHFTYRHARNLPEELKEEIAQDAYLRVWQAYEELDPSRGWRSFVQRHCFGAVMDYLKGGNGSAESETGLSQLRFVNSEDDSSVSVEDTAAVFGVFQPSILEAYKPKQNWELINRMIFRDEDLHIVAKALCGYSQEQISEQMALAIHPEGTDISRERISQRIHEFFERLDSKFYLFRGWVDKRGFGKEWIEQCIYALGLYEHFHMEPHDNGMGWDLPQFDANLETSFKDVQQYHQPTFGDHYGVDM